MLTTRKYTTDDNICQEIFYKKNYFFKSTKDRRRAVFYKLFVKVGNFLKELRNVLEGTVNGCEADIRNFVYTAEFFQNQLADIGGINLVLKRVLQGELYLIRNGFHLLAGNVAFIAGGDNGTEQLASVKGFAGFIALYHYQRNRFDNFVCSKTLLAFFTLSAAAYGRMVCGGTGIYNLAFGIRTHRTFHNIFVFPFGYCNLHNIIPLYFVFVK